VTGGVVVTAEFTLLHGRGQWPVPTTLEWSPDDPLAVRLLFEFRKRTVEWFVARGLLIDALTSDEAGDGDVQFWRPSECPGCVGVELDCPNGHAEFHAPREALIDLVVASERGFRAALVAWRDTWAAEQVPA
jgi:hypothetical protein